MSLIIPRKLRTLVEGYVARKDRHLEKGGYLVGRENVVTGFLPVPNFSDSSHTSSYFINPHATRGIAEEFAGMVGGGVIGDLHTHPNGTIPSEQDGVYTRNVQWPYHVILSDAGERFDWYCIDNGLRGVMLTETDKELEGVMELVAGELSMFDMGRFFVTPKGELLSTKKDGLAFVEIDADALAVWQWGKGKNTHYATAAEASRALKMPYSCARRVFKKLGWGSSS